MKIIKIKTDGLAHLSYLIIDNDKALVIDPRRDASVYFHKAREHGAKIEYIFESHRNEDFITGSRELKRHCNAEIYHGKGINFEFGSYLNDGDIFELDNLCIKAIHTPGHTPESFSFALFPDDTCNDAVAVFTGDALFVGDVGRTDFFPNDLKKYATMLYDSIHKKILPLGDHVVLYPAHGAGSVCGGGISDREVSTLGHEKLNNRLLQLTKEEFIEKKINETHQKPPYFKMMERVNLEGDDSPLLNYNHLKLLSVNELNNNFDDYQVVDIRQPESFIGCHIPNSLSIPSHMLSAYAGYFLNYEKGIVLIADNENEIDSAKESLLNLGFDNIEASLNGGIASWEVSGNGLTNINILDAKKMFDHNVGGKYTLLDVRKPNEWEEGIINGARTIFLGDLPNCLNELDSRSPIIAYCGSGKRATIGASILKINGFSDVTVFMGSMKAYKNFGEK